MKYICLVIAFLSTLCWVNIMFVEYINAKINPYQKSNEDLKIDEKRSILKTILIVIMSIFWSVVIMY